MPRLLFDELLLLLLPDDLLEEELLVTLVFDLAGAEDFTRGGVELFTRVELLFPDLPNLVLEVLFGVKIFLTSDENVDLVDLADLLAGIV